MYRGERNPYYLLFHHELPLHPDRKIIKEACLAAVATKDGFLPLHFPDTLLGFGAARRGLCWGYLDIYSLQLCHQAQ